MSEDSPTKKEIKSLKEIKQRSKGRPVGIWIEKDIAQSLVEKKLAEWAVPCYPLADTENIRSVRLTSWGEVHTY